MTDDQTFPAPDVMHPVKLADGTVHTGTVFLAAAISHPRIHVGDYTYASAHQAPADWARHLAPYTYDFSPERLVIGKFCQIADGVQFITSSANHRYDGISSYPFAIFGRASKSGRPSLPEPGADTIVGNDVWIGQGACILPGARIGHGVIVGAGSVVGGEIADYSVVAGNPARPVRRRFSPQVAARLVHLAWWDWPIEKVVTSEAVICGGDVDALAQVAPR
ncbi:CatB-related O-acetyltransferase [Roseobacter sp. YSTF-M11]|uniref:CatB-related O-acetyltransferase n=1 Tax=Roseobacter insulae TaxID=2859783 RepID=A0A9X1FUG5_9RHOB|nr:CatB-related O-acetyltransferase [Roseobacter insulae]MBW4707320.1 CatB-related O-acetyltransferase [Roseobacter insulae]